MSKDTKDYTLPLLIIVRHGQTDFNLQRRFQGQLDVPLNKLGHEQAVKTSAELLKLLGNLPNSYISHCHLLSSDLARALDTAKAVHKNLVQYHKTSKLKIGKIMDLETSLLLREQHVGDLQNKTLDTFHLEAPELAKEYEKIIKEDPIHAKPPGKLAESKYDLAVRLHKLLSTHLIPAMKEKKPELHIWFSHGWTINALLELTSVYMGRPDSYIGNGDILTLAPDFSAQRSDLSAHVKLDFKLRILEHIKVGEHIEGLSFTKKVA